MLVSELRETIRHLPGDTYVLVDRSPGSTYGDVHDVEKADTCLMALVKSADQWFSMDDDLFASQADMRRDAVVLS